MAKAAVASDKSATFNYHKNFSSEEGYLFQTLQTEHDNLANDFIALLNRWRDGVVDHVGLDDGSAAGKIKTTRACSFRINGLLYYKGATDNLWDLSAETDTAAAKYRGYILYLNSSGTASFAAQTAADSASAAAALTALLADPGFAADKCPIGVFIAGPSTDMSADAIVAKANAVTYNGWPTADTPAVSTI